jgi:ABC-type multidrug transport system fused ATPase/permease subunit
LPAENENVAQALTEVTEHLSLLFREEVELAKAEVTVKAASAARGAAAVAVGAVFGVFALIFVLLTIAWGLNDAFGDLWLGFLIVSIFLVMLTVFAFMFAWRKLRVGAPTPTMAIDEAKKIRAVVRPSSESESESTTVASGGPS